MSLVIPNKNGIRRVDDDRMTITIDLHILMYWFDNRIITNFTTEEVTEGRIPFGVNEIKHMWKPDLYIYNLSKFKTLSALDPVAGLAILTNYYWDEFGKGRTINVTLIEYYIESEVTIYCNFFLNLYPMDEQECELKIGSSNNGRNLEIQLVETSWKRMYDTGYYQSKDFDIEVYFRQSQYDYLGTEIFANLKEVGFTLKL